MPGLHLSIATTDYDHFRDFRLGLVTAEGIEHFWLNLGHHECFARFTANREFDVAELSFAKFMTQVSREDSDIIGLPVVCSRLFRFSSFYVNKKSGITKIEDLKGKKVGSPESAHSAAVYMRGWMHNEMGVKLTDVHWYQAGANAPGREEKVELNLPKGLQLTRVSDKSLSELLAAQEIDCAIIARPPNCFLEGHPDAVDRGVAVGQHRHLRELRQSLGVFEGALQVAVGRRDLVDQSHRVSLVDVDDPAAQDHVECPAQPDDARQALGPAVHQRHAPAALGEAQLGALGRDPQVAPQRQLQTAGQAPA